MNDELKEFIKLILMAVFIVGSLVSLSYPFYQGTLTGVVTEKIMNDSYYIEVDNNTVYRTSLELYAKLEVGDKITFDYGNALMFPDRYMIEATIIE